MSTRILVFAVAVEKYQKAAIDSVAFAENDARDFMKAWQTLGADPSDCIILLIAHATKTAIESSFKKFLGGVTKADTVIFFFAGHGIAYNDVSYLTTHDTQPGDIKATSISLTLILNQFRESKSDRVMLFIDACESGLPVAAGMRSITSSFSGEELRQFCEDAAHHVGFAACKVHESSWPNSSLKHGIWSYALIKALSGDAKNALDKGNLMTGDSLRDYLADEVPRLLRTTRSGNETQTPCCFGNATKQFIVADFAQIFADRAAKANALGSAMKDASLRGEKFGSVRRLSGFKKRYRVPDGHFTATEAFVKRIGHEEVKEQADVIHERIRETFGYKRKDINYSCDDGAATIKTPDFDVNLWIMQDPGDPSVYVLTTEVGAIRRPAIITEDGFSDVFSRYCDTVVIEFSRNIDLKDKIDEIEDLPELKGHLKYEADCSSFKLNLPTLQICVTAKRITLSLPGTDNIKVLLDNAKNALAALSSSGVVLLLPDKTRP
jgi:hypothetical protein